MRLLLSVAVLLTSALAGFAQSPAAAAAEEKWVELFNGKTLDGWEVKGGDATYHVDGNEIVGTSKPNTKNTFLCTKKEYGDFVLEVEFKVDPGLNSGVQFRSRYSDQPLEEVWNGKTVKVAAGRVHGTQAEIDPSKRAWTGGVYCEGAAGWLNDLKENEAARNAFKQNEWNKFRIVAKGDHIQTWINGVPAADLRSDTILKGFIGLQVHGVKAKETPMEVRFRNIRIQELQ